MGQDTIVLRLGQKVRHRFFNLGIGQGSGDVFIHMAVEFKIVIKLAQRPDSGLFDMNRRISVIGHESAKVPVGDALDLVQFFISDKGVEFIEPH
jgi:hypothetical protein